MAIEIVDFPIENGYFYSCVKLPKGIWASYVKNMGCNAKLDSKWSELG